MADIISTFLFEYPLLLKGELEISRKLYGVSDPERCGGVITAQAVKHQCQGLRRSADYGPVNQPNCKDLGGPLAFSGTNSYSLDSTC